MGRLDGRLRRLEELRAPAEYCTCARPFDYRAAVAAIAAPGRTDEPQITIDLPNVCEKCGRVIDVLHITLFEYQATGGEHGEN